MPCPVQGAVHFTDDFGAPRGSGRTHQGIDVFAPQGTPNVAVASGVITEQFESGFGNYVTLAADDGTTYLYAHLAGFEGGDRRVATGEVIGYTGNSGNADGIHTHFELHPGGGAAVNPYPTLERICTTRV
jgi:murein DD-endopeptidase MepM/ murein hydrolase activator NlpD